MSDYEKVLIGDSIPLMEVDDEEDSTLNYELISDAEINADITDILQTFGKEEFKELYLNLYDEITNLPIETQRNLCEKLCDKIYELYEFEFTPILTFDDTVDTSNFLDFIEFLEFDYIYFLSEIIQGLDLNQLKKDLNLFLTMNWDRINISIDKLVDEERISMLISNFLRTYNREGLYEFIRSKLEKDKMLVILKVMEKEKWNNE